MPTPTRKRLSAIQRQQLQLRNDLWPSLDESTLWARDKADGWLSVPRAMPLILQTMDSMSKGKPISGAYLDLWFRTYDNSFVIVNKEREMAFYAGFSGERGVRTWVSRIKILKELSFIDVKEGPNGPVSYILIRNPYLALQSHHAKGQIADVYMNALKQRMIEIGAKDLTPPSRPRVRAGTKLKSVGAVKP